MSVALRQFNKGNNPAGTPVSVAYPSNLLLGSFLLATVQVAASSGTIGVSDSVGNTWVQIGTTTVALSEIWAIFYCASNKTPGPDTVTATSSSTGSSILLMITEQTGQNAATPLQAATALASSASNPFTSPNLTTTFANEELIFIGWTSPNNVVTVTSPAGFVIETQPGPLGAYIIDSSSVAASPGTYNIVTTSVSGVAVGWLLALNSSAPPAAFPFAGLLW